MNPTKAPPVRPPARIAAALLWLMIILCSLLLLDNLLAQFFGPSKPKGTDFLFIAVAGGFLIVAAFAKKARQKLALAMFASLLVLLPLEIALTIASRQARPFDSFVNPPGLHRVLEPRRIKGASPVAVMTTNSLGLRGPEFSDEDRVRILCIGGSTTECLYLDDTRTWPALLGQKLNADKPGVWVGNAGRSGLNCIDHLTLVRHLPEAWKVDCWLVLCGVNDLNMYRHGTADDRIRRSYELTFPYRRPGISSTLQRPLQRNLYTWHLMEKVFQRIKEKMSDPNRAVAQDREGEWVEQTLRHLIATTTTAETKDFTADLQRYRGYLQQIIAEARTRKITVVFATQPTSWSAKPPDDIREHLKALGADEIFFQWQANSALALDQFNQVMRDLCKAEGMQCIDVARVVPPNTECFYDDCHFTEQGAEVVAAHLAGALKEHIATFDRRAAAPAP
ncbi:MAG: SGNH/GDSL hydrolase family protein [Phycisphaeraceae bacterium]